MYYTLRHLLKTKHWLTKEAGQRIGGAQLIAWWTASDMALMISTCWYLPL